ncbi:unnamed protein product [Ilex paraguariensis]|uniref:Protein kinase domain-containing protein n=1 Tax=Ilex paraguariensis TaxID=185542 RepID=A0ABC8R148_9AQUA
MAVSDIEAVIKFLRKNGLSESESALMEDILEKSKLGSADFERFLFPMVPPPPPLKIPSIRRQSEEELGLRPVDSNSGSSDDEFVSLGSSTTELCSSEFTNPYGVGTATGANSQASSDRLSQFGTARDYHDFDMQNDLYWYKEKDEDYAMPHYFGGSDCFGGPSEDKFVMTQETEKQREDQSGLNPICADFQSVEITNYLDKPWPFDVTSTNDIEKVVGVTDYFNLDAKNLLLERGIEKDKEVLAVYSCLSPLCVCCAEGRENHGRDPADYNLGVLKVPEIDGFQKSAKGVNSECDSALEYNNNKCCDHPTKRDSIYDVFGDFKSNADFHSRVANKDLLSNEYDNNDYADAQEVVGEPHAPDAVSGDEGGVASDELQMYSNEDEYEVFNLRIIHRKNRTGFEENKDLPIVINSIIAGRYYVTEYLGSAAFSKVVQAHDLCTGMDVCLKIIKNDKDFFDQSLDEIKLLKFVNKHDPGDDRHILRLYDYFYFQLIHPSNSSEFTNPYGVGTATGANSQASSDRLSQFGTARDYHDFDMQNDLYWYKEKDEDYAMPHYFGGSDCFGGPSEDKFVMTQETEKQREDQSGLNPICADFQSVEITNYLDKPWPFDVTSTNDIEKVVGVTDYFNLDAKNLLLERGIEKDKEVLAVYSCLSPLCVCCAEGRENHGRDPADYNLGVLKVPEIDGFQKSAKGVNSECDSALEYNNNKCCDHPTKRDSIYDVFGDFKSNADFHSRVANKDLLSNEYDNNDYADAQEVVGEPHAPDAVSGDEGGVASDELQMYSNEDEYEVFNLRIIHRKNRTGFEENKDLPIVINSIIAGRYYVTEYLGSAAFSKVVQAHDLCTGMDVCLKIIKNDKDFFDQSLDEIKLLKFVNKHDPGDDRHILRLYDYFYFQEHLIIVCELLRANLYEFQKYNRESGGEPYFTVSRLQVITRQCLEALEYLHELGIMHCDLKPENILIKSYRRCDIKVIDLGSSCFQTDNLCLYVQSRSYRAPEVILGLPYDQKIDLWSLGCILAELCSGEVLLPNEAIVMLLARMIGMLGPIDEDMLMRGQETYKYFTKDYDLYLINEETNQLEYIIPEESSLEHHLQVSDIGFISFVKELLEINPQRRPTAREALEHPWLSHSYELNSY